MDDREVKDVLKKYSWGIDFGTSVKFDKSTAIPLRLATGDVNKDYETISKIPIAPGAQSAPGASNAAKIPSNTSLLLKTQHDAQMNDVARNFIDLGNKLHVTSSPVQRAPQFISPAKATEAIVTSLPQLDARFAYTQSIAQAKKEAETAEKEYQASVANKESLITRVKKHIESFTAKKAYEVLEENKPNFFEDNYREEYLRAWANDARSNYSWSAARMGKTLYEAYPDVWEKITDIETQYGEGVSDMYDMYSTTEANDLLDILAEYANPYSTDESIGYKWKQYFYNMPFFGLKSQKVHDKYGIEYGALNNFMSVVGQFGQTVDFLSNSVKAAIASVPYVGEFLTNVEDYQDTIYEDTNSYPASDHPLDKWVATFAANIRGAAGFDNLDARRYTFDMDVKTGNGLADFAINSLLEYFADPINWVSMGSNGIFSNLGKPAREVVSNNALGYTLKSYSGSDKLFKNANTYEKRITKQFGAVFAHDLADDSTFRATRKFIMQNFRDANNLPLTSADADKLLAEAISRTMTATENRATINILSTIRGTRRDFDILNTSLNILGGGAMYPVMFAAKKGISSASKAVLASRANSPDHNLSKDIITGDFAKYQEDYIKLIEDHLASDPEFKKRWLIQTEAARHTNFDGWADGSDKLLLETFNKYKDQLSDEFKAKIKSDKDVLDLLRSKRAYEIELKKLYFEEIANLKGDVRAAEREEEELINDLIQERLQLREDINADLAELQKQRSDIFEMYTKDIEVLGHVRDELFEKLKYTRVIKDSYVASVDNMLRAPLLRILSKISSGVDPDVALRESVSIIKNKVVFSQFAQFKSFDDFAKYVDKMFDVMEGDSILKDLLQVVKKIAANKADVTSYKYNIAPVIDEMRTLIENIKNGPHTAPEVIAIESALNKAAGFLSTPEYRNTVRNAKSLQVKYSYLCQFFIYDNEDLSVLNDTLKNSVRDFLTNKGIKGYITSSSRINIDDFFADVIPLYDTKVTSEFSREEFEALFQKMLAYDNPNLKYVQGAWDEVSSGKVSIETYETFIKTLEGKYKDLLKVSDAEGAVSSRSSKFLDAIFGIYFNNKNYVREFSITDTVNDMDLDSAREVLADYIQVFIRDNAPREMETTIAQVAMESDAPAFIGLFEDANKAMEEADFDVDKASDILLDKILVDIQKSEPQTYDEETFSRMAFQLKQTLGTKPDKNAYSGFIGMLEKLDKSIRNYRTTYNDYIAEKAYEAVLTINHVYRTEKLYNSDLFVAIEEFIDLPKTRALINYAIASDAKKSDIVSGDSMLALGEVLRRIDQWAEHIRVTEYANAAIRNRFGDDRLYMAFIDTLERFGSNKNNSNIGSDLTNVVVEKMMINLNSYNNMSLSLDGYRERLLNTDVLDKLIISKFGKDADIDAIKLELSSSSHVSNCANDVIFNELVYEYECNLHGAKVNPNTYFIDSETLSVFSDSAKYLNGNSKSAHLTDFAIKKYGKNETVHWAVKGQSVTDATKVIWCESEAELCMRVVKYLIDNKVHVIAGHNLDGFDLKFFMDRLDSLPFDNQGIAKALDLSPEAIVSIGELQKSASKLSTDDIAEILRAYAKTFRETYLHGSAKFTDTLQDIRGFYNLPKITAADREAVRDALSTYSEIAKMYGRLNVKTIGTSILEDIRELRRVFSIYADTSTEIKSLTDLSEGAMPETNNFDAEWTAILDDFAKRLDEYTENFKYIMRYGEADASGTGNIKDKVHLFMSDEPIKNVSVSDILYDSIHNKGTPVDRLNSMGKMDPAIAELIEYGSRVDITKEQFKAKFAELLYSNVSVFKDYGMNVDPNMSLWAFQQLDKKNMYQVISDPDVLKTAINPVENLNTDSALIQLKSKTRTGNYYNNKFFAKRVRQFRDWLDNGIKVDATVLGKLFNEENAPDVVSVIRNADPGKWYYLLDEDEVQKLSPTLRSLLYYFIEYPDHYKTYINRYGWESDADAFKRAIFAEREAIMRDMERELSEAIDNSIDPDILKQFMDMDEEDIAGELTDTTKEITTLIGDRAALLEQNKAEIEFRKEWGDADIAANTERINAVKYRAAVRIKKDLDLIGQYIEEVRIEKSKIRGYTKMIKEQAAANVENRSVYYQDYLNKLADARQKLIEDLNFYKNNLGNVFPYYDYKKWMEWENDTDMCFFYHIERDARDNVLYDPTDVLDSHDYLSELVNTKGFETWSELDRAVALERVIDELASGNYKGLEREFLINPVRNFVEYFRGLDTTERETFYNYIVQESNKVRTLMFAKQIDSWMDNEENLVRDILFWGGHNKIKVSNLELNYRLENLAKKYPDLVRAASVDREVIISLEPVTTVKTIVYEFSVDLSSVKITDVSFDEAKGLPRITLSDGSTYWQNLETTFYDFKDHGLESIKKFNDIRRNLYSLDPYMEMYTFNSGSKKRLENINLRLQESSAFIRERAMTPDELEKVNFFNNVRYTDANLVPVGAQGYITEYNDPVLTLFKKTKDAYNFMSTKNRVLYFMFSDQNPLRVSNTSGIFKGMSDEEIVEFFRNNEEFQIGCLVKNKSDQGYYVTSITIDNVKDLEFARTHQGTVMNYGMLSEAHDSINDVASMGTFTKFLAKAKTITLPYKLGWLANTSTWLNNFMDSNMRAIIDSEGGFRYIQDYIDGDKILKDYYSDLNNILKSKDKNTELTTSIVRRYFKDNPKVALSEDEFWFVHNFMQYGASGGLSRSQQAEIAGYTAKKGKLATKVSDFLLAPMGYVESRARFGQYLTLVRKGYVPSEANFKVKHTAFDYSMKSRADKALETLIPFWTFQKNNMLWWDELFMNNPAAMSTVFRVIDEAQDTFDYEEQDLLNPYNGSLRYALMSGWINMGEAAGDIVIKPNPSFLDALKILMNPSELKNSIFSPLRKAINIDALKGAVASATMGNNQMASWLSSYFYDLVSDPEMYPFIGTISQRWINFFDGANNTSPGTWEKNLARASENVGTENDKAGWALPFIFFLPGNFGVYKYSKYYDTFKTNPYDKEEDPFGYEAWAKDYLKSNTMQSYMNKLLGSPKIADIEKYNYYTSEFYPFASEKQRAYLFQKAATAVDPYHLSGGYALSEFIMANLPEKDPNTGYRPMEYYSMMITAKKNNPYFPFSSFFEEAYYDKYGYQPKPLDPNGSKKKENYDNFVEYCRSDLFPYSSEKQKNYIEKQRAAANDPWRHTYKYMEYNRTMDRIKALKDKKDYGKEYYALWEYAKSLNPYFPFTSKAEYDYYLINRSNPYISDKQKKFYKWVESPYWPYSSEKQKKYFEGNYSKNSRPSYNRRYADRYGFTSTAMKKFMRKHFTLNWVLSKVRKFR